MLQNNQLLEICANLEAGKLVLLQTETIWGILCDATNDATIQQLIKLKSAKPNEGMVTLVADYEMLTQHVIAIDPKIDLLLQYHTRPITVVYPNVRGISPLVTKSNQYAIRIANNHFCQALVRQFNKPLVATSAAVSGTPDPTSFGKISSDILQGVHHIVKANQDDKTPRAPSPIVVLNEKSQELEFIRE